MGMVGHEAEHRHDALKLLSGALKQLNLLLDNPVLNEQGLPIVDRQVKCNRHLPKVAIPRESLGSARSHTLIISCR